MNKYFLLTLISSLALITPAWSAGATAVMKGTAADSSITGLVTLTEETEGILIKAQFSNVPPGDHGFHIHEKGNCDDLGNAAGGHFNPDQTPHGLYPAHTHQSHAGDMGNVTANTEGNVDFSIFMPGLTLNKGKYAVNNLAIILHDKKDDFGQPTGNAGGRIACGVIQQQN